jgi:hypothetical protein
LGRIDIWEGDIWEGTGASVGTRRRRWSLQIRPAPIKTNGTSASTPSPAILSGEGIVVAALIEVVLAFFFRRPATGLAARRRTCVPRLARSRAATASRKAARRAPDFARVCFLTLAPAACGFADFRAAAARAAAAAAALAVEGWAFACFAWWCLA